MAQICIQIPPLDRAHTIELEVSIDGKKRLVNYRVESFDWGAPEIDSEERVENLKRLINGYDPGWELVQIGNPSEELIPVMFRQKG